MLRFIVIFFAGAMGALLANRGISVFNDAVRPVVPEYREGRMTRVEFFTTTFGLSFGLVIGFGLPYSVMSPIILVHSLWLGTDIIGAVFPAKNIEDWWKDKESLIGAIGSFAVGGLYGVALLVGLQGLVSLMQSLPVNVFDAWQNISGPVISAFIAFPCVVIAMDYGWKRGIAALVLTVLVRQCLVAAGFADIADGIALLAGLLLVIIFAFKVPNPESEGHMADIFADRVRNIRKNIVWIAIMGAIYGVACNIHLLMEGPQSLTALADGNVSAAVSIATARAISFIPLKGLTSLATGTFVTDGFGFTTVAGLLAPNILVAAIAGAIVMSAEALSLTLVAKVFDKAPAIRNSADNIRVAMTKLLEVAILVGSMTAAEGMAPGFGFLTVSGLFVMNEYFKKPITRMAVGPIAVIAVGILINLFAVSGLYIPAA
ncbi:YhfT family protein [Olsenella sp. AM04-33]|uniref:YhfT family protein n=1 Tax=Olsenella sp. AM04-33 TaxID=2292049 RepID=UPI000E48357F|nr:YhfT family protein [Olsenella sp. AM04-33]RHK02226.1 hypothetical protein DW087_07630 [Olsenella sp. AM04-33]